MGNRRSNLLNRLFPPPGGSTDAERLVTLCHALLSELGDVSGARLAGEIVAGYSALTEQGRDALFDLLLREFESDQASVLRAVDAYRLDPSSQHLTRLRAAVESRRQELFRRINLGREGTATLVSMRREILNRLTDRPDLSALDSDLSHLFRSWFNGGFLRLQRIDWHTSGVVLERLIQYEAVHQIQGWGDLRRRLESDRRCYAYFHSALPDDPLIFIEIALTRGLSERIQPLIDPASPVTDASRADTAIFYSITNCQEGLRGISFGNLLIKQVVDDLGRAFRRISTFATLSPIPGFRRWLESAEPRLHLGETTWSKLEALKGTVGLSPNSSVPRALQDELRRLCAYYLICAKKDDAPVDTVARFHLANGARLERINWAGDTSRVGLERSFGLTANYLYDLSQVEQNHEAYAKSHQVMASRSLIRLAERVRAEKKDSR